MTLQFTQLAGPSVQPGVQQTVLVFGVNTPRTASARNWNTSFGAEDLVKLTYRNTSLPSKRAGQ